MNVRLVPAAPENKKVIENLMQFYMYDFSEYVKLELNASGLYEAYPSLDDYWKENSDRFPYLFRYNEIYIGFALVRWIVSAERNYFSIAEFFVMKTYRRAGIGTSAATELFNLHRGLWEVYQKENNQPAYLFWHRIINEYTKGRFTERTEAGKIIQDFES